MISLKKTLKDRRLYLILDRGVCDYKRLLEVLKVAIEGGVDIVQLRDKKGSDRDILEFSKNALQICKGRVLFIMNDRVDLALAAGADGVHLGQEDGSVKEARAALGPKAVIGVSCQTLAHAKKAEKEGADYLGFGSVFKTLTKPERQPMDLKLLAKVIREISIPVFPIGGINLKNVATLGVERAAVCRAILEAKDPRAAAGAFRKILGEGNSMVECQLPKLTTRVRFPSLAPKILVLFLAAAISGCATIDEGVPSGPTATTTASRTTTSPRKGIYHKVHKGETLWKIANLYDMNVDDIIQSNNIPKAALIERDQLIFIPGAERVRESQTQTQKTDFNAKEFQWPIKGKVVSYFGERRGGKLLKGVRIKTKEGESIHAARQGRVVFADYLNGYGHTVILDHGDGYYSVYAQNSVLTVKLDDSVSRGATIAKAGGQGRSGFLHFEIRRNETAQNPLYFLPRNAS